MTNPLLKKDSEIGFMEERKTQTQEEIEKSFDNFISFKNMEKKKDDGNRFSIEDSMEDDNLFIERAMSSININKEILEKPSFLNISDQQLQFHSYPQTFVIYKNYSILDIKEKNFLENYSIKPFSKDKTQMALEKYENLARLIENHLTELKHPLCKLKNEYINYFIEANHKKASIKELKPNKMDEYKKAVRYMIKDIKCFVCVFKEAINNFYDLETISKKFKTIDFELFSDYNIINFIYSIIFTDELYSTLFDSLKAIEKYKEIIYKRNVELLKTEKPEKFLVKDKFCLNDRTTEFFAKKIDPNLGILVKNPKASHVKKNSIKTIDLNLFELQTRIFPHLLMNSFNKSEFLNKKKTDRNNRKNINPKNTEKPYFDSIDILKNLQFLKNPAHKMKLITEAFEMIEDCIIDYYESHGYDQKFILIEPEDLISIIVYILTKSSVTYIITHCSFIEQYFNETNLNAKSACYLYSLKTGIEYILNAIDDN